MAAVSQWAEIESDAGHGRIAVSPAAGPTSGVRHPAQLRLKRTDRIIVGSIDAGAHVLQRRARHVLLGSAAFMVPMAAVQLALSLFALSRFQQFEGLLGDRGYLGAERGASLVAVLVESLTAHLVGAYAAAYLVAYQLGGDPHLWPTLRRVLRRLPLLCGTWAVSHAWLGLAAIVYLNGSLDLVTVLAILLSPGVAALAALTLFVAPVVVSEHGRGSIGRAVRLARGRFGSAYGYVRANGLVGLMLLVCITWLPRLVETTGLVTFGSYRWLFEGVAAQLALLVVVPFSAVATAQLYLQVRIQTEGLDIVLAADRVFGGTK